MKHQNIITEIESLEELIEQEHPLASCVVQGLDLREYQPEWDSLELKGSVFMGCRFANEGIANRLRAGGALIFPELPDLPYAPYRPSLYTWQELMQGFDFETGEDQSADKAIYQHFNDTRQAADIVEALAQRIHDHAIDDALGDLLEGSRRPVGIMGGHSTGRDDPNFLRVAKIAWQLARDGYFLVSGGGPGIMEATNLGAWLAPYDEDAIEASINLLKESPKYTDEGFHAAAKAVLDLYPNGGESLAVPTWFYGHEPSNLFATHIAKYFSNSLREDGLLALATSGVIYAPGSAGTLQEVFMDLCQNHYKTLDWVSPMVFLDTDHWTKTTTVWQTLEHFAKERHYEDMLALCDSVEDVVSFIKEKPPRR